MFRRKKEDAEEKRIQEIISREYKMFREQERVSKLPTTLYEKACRASSRIINIEPDGKTKKKLQEAIDFSHMKITPSGVTSFTILVVFAVSFSAFLALITNSMTSYDVPTSDDAAKNCLPYAEGATMCTIPGIGLGLGPALFIILASVLLALYMYRYPFHLKKKYEMETGNEIVTMVLYMAIYLRNTPNMENAVEFASKNLSGPLGFELRKIMWDVEIGNYHTINEALLDYASKWAANKDLVEALELMISSVDQAESRRIAVLDEAMNRILEGARENAKHFTQKLKMPIMVIHAIGIILPVMGLVLFPIVAIFLNVSSIMLFVLYDVILPLILFFVISRSLDDRPATYSKIDVSEHPDLPAKWTFRFGGKNVPAWPFTALIVIFMLTAGIVLYQDNTVTTVKEGVETTELPDQNIQMYSAMLMLSGMAIGLAFYFISTSMQSVGLRDKVQEIEGEFREAMFQFGNTVSGGKPIEIAMDESTKRMETMKIKELFQHASMNIKKLGMTFHQAFFDEQYGAVRYYPSRLIKSVMRTVTESAKKGVKTAAMAMLSISRYLRGLHKTQEDVRASLSDVTGSLRFQAYFLSPFIAGIISTMAIMIIQILQKLGEQTSSVGIAGTSILGNIAMGMAITPFEFIMVVGIYVIESCFLLALLLNGIERGEDATGRKYLTGWLLITSIIVYVVSVSISSVVFTPMLSGMI